MDVKLVSIILTARGKNSVSIWMKMIVPFVLIMEETKRIQELKWADMNAQHDSFSSGGKSFETVMYNIVLLN
jgi:hypothetical protein